MMLPYLRRLYEHLFWADARALSLSEHALGERGLTLLAHLLAAEAVWLARLQGRESQGMPIWPSLSLAECTALAGENRLGYTAYLAALPESALSEPVTYRNSTGQEFHTAPLDILTHVALHGSYHRGQIMQDVRGAGAEPVSTDYIVWVRERRQESEVRRR